MLGGAWEFENNIRLPPELEYLVKPGLTIQPKPKPENGTLPHADSMQVRPIAAPSGHSGQQLWPEQG
jgi:hypothetical protein